MIVRLLLCIYTMLFINIQKSYTQLVHIPDPNFKDCLLKDKSINTNGDNEIQLAEAEAFKGILHCNQENIQDLTGIEAFINITALNCAHNQLTHLNLYANTHLERLYCNNNQLSQLNLQHNPQLISIICNHNQLTYLFLKNGHNKNIRWLNVDGNHQLDCIVVDDPQYSTRTWLFDGTRFGGVYAVECDGKY